jgi:hypothetical protein
MRIRYGFNDYQNNAPSWRPGRTRRFHTGKTIVTGGVFLVNACPPQADARQFTHLFWPSVAPAKGGNVAICFANRIRVV